MAEPPAEQDTPGDKIGRYVVLPSYVCLMTIMLVGNGHHLFASDGCDGLDGLKECTA